MNRDRDLGRWFPAPLVGTAILLVLLIIFTPLLTSNGQPSAGSIFSQAELVVDAIPGNATIHFYVHGLSTTARYDAIAIGFAADFGWTGGWPTGNLSWSNWTNGTNVLSVTAEVDYVPVAVNVSALYVAAGVGALYTGLFALNFTSAAGGIVLSVASNTPGIGGFSTPVADLPVPITLALVRTGAVS